MSEVIIVDDFTVDIMTNAPDPIFPDSIANWMIMDSGLAEANDATRPDKESGNYATLNTNGTGAFAITSREPGLRTVLEPFAGWWGEVTHNITRAELTPIQNDATALAALLAGDVDFINPVPVQDVARLKNNPDVKIIQGVEARVIMLGFANDAATLKYSSETTDANPFADARVRRAVAHAVNVPAILQTTMRGTAEQVNQLVGSGIRGYTAGLSNDAAYDPDAARALLAEAGYPEGFSFGFKCSNDRYLNDEAVCQAITGMLAQVGLRATLDAMPVQNYWPELRSDNFDMFLLGWSPGTFDAEHPIRFLVATPNEEKRLGSWNFGGFSNARIDELLPMIQSEIDDTKRQSMLDEVAQTLQDEMAYVPLYVQPLVWGARANIDVVQRTDDFFILRWVTVN
ncbi:Extracellular solute-binding protein [Sulfitobacter guttiformis KCTC 32187]|nr:Extracellular solute-binding protein [Sulfitobacter guttiformis KCTC 32187]